MTSDSEWKEITDLLAESQKVQDRVEEIERETAALLTAAERNEFDGLHIDRISAASRSVEIELDCLLARIETLLGK